MQGVTASFRPSMLQAEVLHPGALRDADCAAWRTLAAATPQFASPLLDPAFAQAVGQVRRDAAVALFRRGGELVGVLAHHRRPGGVARPIGAPWSDAHALITAPGAPLAWRDALAAAGLRSFRFSHLVDPHGVFAGVAGIEAPAHLVLTPPGLDGEGYWESLRAGSPKRFKNIRRLEHKLEREAGLLEFGADRSPEALAQLLGWKRAQFAQTGAQDVLHPAWSRELIARAAALHGGPVEGLALTLRAAGRVIAGHFGVRAGGAYHPWIAAYDPAFAAYSPGMVFMSMAVREAPRLGVRRYELGAGSDAYKQVFANAAEPSAAGVAALDGAPAPAPGDRLVDRLRRRLDHIAQAEITLPGRLHGLASAVAGVRRLPPSSLVPGDA